VQSSVYGALVQQQHRDRYRLDSHMDNLVVGHNECPQCYLPDRGDLRQDPHKKVIFPLLDEDTRRVAWLNGVVST
jgi:hypothetical protein